MNQIFLMNIKELNILKRNFGRTPLNKRFLNEDEYAKFENNFVPLKYFYGHPVFYGIKRVNVGEIIQWKE